MDNETREQELEVKEEKAETPCILEEINIDELARRWNLRHLLSNRVASQMTACP